MTKKIIFSSLIILLLFNSCIKDAEMIAKQHPVLQTHDVSGITPDGVTFNGEFLTLGDSDITAYGFVYSTSDPNLDTSDTVLISSGTAKGEFSKTITNGVAGNISYNVRAFAKTADQIIYGNKVSFFSQGSKFNPWDLTLQPQMRGWSDAHGTSNDELGFILFQSGNFYTFCPEANAVMKKQDIPINGNSATYYASFCLDNYLYVLSNHSQQILRYDIENDQWTKLGNRPFIPPSLGDFFGFSIGNTGYFLGDRNFYAYNQSADTWSKKPDFHTFSIYSADVVDNKAYVFADNRELWVYDPDTDTWEKETEYPGIWKWEIISLSSQDHLYLGLSYSYEEVAQDFWRYSVRTKSWEPIEKFPVEHSRNEVFSFSIGKMGFIGFRSSDYVRDIWRFSGEKFNE